MKSVLKKITFIILFSSFIACSSDNSSTNSSNNSSTSSLLGKWAYGPARPCGLRNYFELKPNNVYIENRYSNTCLLTSYPDEYQITGENEITFFGNIVNDIVELTPTKLVLYDPSTNETTTHDRIN